jgi:hypothetical protein
LLRLACFQTYTHIKVLCEMEMEVIYENIQKQVYLSTPNFPN